MSNLHKRQFDLTDLIGLMTLTAVVVYLSSLVLNDSFRIGWLEWSFIGIFPAATLVVFKFWTVSRRERDFRNRAVRLATPLSLSALFTVAVYFITGSVSVNIHWEYSLASWEPIRPYAKILASTDSPHARTPFLVAAVRSSHSMLIYSIVPVAIGFILFSGVAYLIRLFYRLTQPSSCTET